MWFAFGDQAVLLSDGFSVGGSIVGALHEVLLRGRFDSWRGIVLDRLVPFLVLYSLVHTLRRNR